MRDYTLMLVGDERSPVRRFHLQRHQILRAIWGGSVLALVLIVGFWDYWRLRADNAELSSLRIEAAEQREQIAIFRSTLTTVEGELARVNELERKVRIIANLPGAAAAGGDEVTLLAPRAVGENGEPIPSLPLGVPSPTGHDGGGEGPALDGQGGIEPDLEGFTTGGAQLLDSMDDHAHQLIGRASVRSDSLDDLMGQLEEKSSKLSSMPSVWPARGWLTSRFGYRVSPFTGKRQHHSGLDIAAKPGSPVIAPANGRVKFVGRKGPLGNAVVIDHGYGVRTLYGHNSDLHVEAGDTVVRGQQIASVGSTGRSTGPHLHYVVEVNGKPRDPLNYIFD